VQIPPSNVAKLGHVGGRPVLPVPEAAITDLCTTDDG